MVLLLVLSIFYLFGKFIELVSIQKLAIFIHGSLHIDERRLMRGFKWVHIEILFRVGIRKTVL